MDYTTLITSEHQGQPKFMQWLNASLSMVQDAKNFLDSVYGYFDIDRAVGDQLDKIGELLGTSRKLQFQPPDSFYRLKINGKTVLTGSGTKSPENPYALSAANQITVSDGNGISQSYSFNPLYDFDDTTYDTLEIVSGGKISETEVKELDGTEPWGYDSNSLNSAGGTNLSLSDSQDGGEFTIFEIEGKTLQNVTNQGKNLFEPKLGTVTTNGVTCTVGQDQSITLNGTATNGFNVEISPKIISELQYNNNALITMTTGQTYTVSRTVVSGTASSVPTIVVYDNQGVVNPTNAIAFLYGDQTQITAGTAWYPTFSTSLNIGVFGMSIPAGSIFDNYKIEIQFEQGTSATSWAPFITVPSPDYPAPISGVTSLTVSDGESNSQTINLPQPLYSLTDSIKDNYNVLIGSGTKNIGSITLTGNETFTLSRPTNSQTYNFQLDSTFSSGVTANINVISSHYPFFDTIWDEEINHPCCYVYGNQFVIKYPSTEQTITTTAALESFLAAQYSAGTPVTTIYELSSSGTISGTAQGISTYSTTNITNDANGNMNVTYVNDLPILYCSAQQSLNQINYCTHFNIQNSDSWDNQQAIGFFNNFLYIKISKTIVKTISEFKTWLSVASVKFLNKLNQPVSSEVTGQIITAYSPQTIVTRDIDSYIIGTYSFSSLLDDKHYRLLLKLTIAKAHFDGTIPSFKSILNIALNDASLQILLEDNQDMTMSIVVYGEVEPIIESMLRKGLLLPNPDGVLTSISVTSNKMFSWNIESDIQGGWNEGYWVI